ncbi:hypothetical protein [Arthrospira platensis]|nr:hypothetical protein [Arthrospira platensis]AMW27240.1 hypothetical protein AP285_03790 [Arthrospira platensis YZ]KDR57286.1 hypothetical protein APPUASWS_011685 [Arthrospira platensis str. Paraca]MBD2672196.1 hypothetical protein [Arthrospira platensis FACHB-439]MBD2713295.1 hypothetical protein [Arthrospira platensis FACHB-835]MDF2212991.1 hypothetical protein [Arthrospira platensis NCB002]BAI91318.1 hypothetical protein NIES39_J02710 [Arthrospira platensis NIES-39]
MTTALYSSEKPQDLTHLPGGQYELAAVNLWDSNLSSMLYAKKVIFKRHFLLPGFPSDGFPIIRELKALANVPIQYRTINEFPKTDRQTDKTDSRNRNDYRFLVEQWLERIEYLCQTFDFLEVLPVSALLRSWQSQYLPNAYVMLKQRETIKQVSLDIIEAMDPECLTDNRVLSEEGWRQLFINWDEESL